MPGPEWQRIQPGDTGKTVASTGDVYLERRSSQKSAEPSGRVEQPSCPSGPLRTPLYAWPLLVLSVLAPSTSGPVFHTLPDVAPITVAAWRLQATALMLLAPGAWQLLQLDQGQRRRLRSQAHLLAASGVSLGVHFGAWVWGLYHTSLPHSLLCVTSSPVLLALGCLILRKPISAGAGCSVHFLVVVFVCALSGHAQNNKACSTWVSQCWRLPDVRVLLRLLSDRGTARAAPQPGPGPGKSHAGELGGSALAGIGAILLAAGSGSNAGVTLIGDLVCLASSCCFLVYMAIGRSVRSWMGLFVYVLPVNLVAATVLTLASAVCDGTRPWKGGLQGTFGWPTDMRYLPPIAWLAAGPGVLGHTSLAALLKWMHPLQVVLPQSINPILGSVEGWLIGVSLLPSGWMTYLGGAIVLVASAFVLVSSHFRTEAQAGAPEHVEGAKLAAAQSRGAIQLNTMHDPEAGALLHAPQAASQNSPNLEADTPLQHDQEGVRDLEAAPLLHDHEAAALTTPT